MKQLLTHFGYKLDPDNRIWIADTNKSIAYNDGDGFENRLLEILKQTTDLSIHSVELSTHCQDWPSSYHLSATRANLMRPFNDLLQPGTDVLEIGAGCGAITRYLGESGANILALEGSQRRASITRLRTRDLSNVEVLAEQFDCFECDRQFDVITLIGVLEYAGMFTKGKDPYIDMLKRACLFLKPQGKLIIAIENQLGLKYFAGSNEDHFGKPMVGIEGLYSRETPQTFGRAAIVDMLQKAGFKKTNFLIPFPDYKFPVSIITEEGSKSDDFDASAFAWQSVHKDQQQPRKFNFSLELAWPEIFNNHLGLELANSFLIIASPYETSLINKNILAYHYSTRRKKEYAKQTVFIKQPSEEIKIEYSILSNKPINECNQVIKFKCLQSQKYIFGQSLDFELIKILSQDGWTIEEVGRFVKKYLLILKKFVGDECDITSLCTKIKGSYFDAIPQNIIKDKNNQYFLIDQEWQYIKPIEVGYLLFRALLTNINSRKFLRASASFEKITYYQFITSVFTLVGLELTTKDYKKYLENEVNIQFLIVGTSASDRSIEELLDQHQKEFLPIASNNIQVVKKEKNIDDKNEKNVKKIKKSVARKTFKRAYLKVRAFIENKKIRSTIARSGLFDRKWYLNQNSDVAAARVDPLKHYIKFGEKESRNPHPLFHVNWYLSKYKDVKNEKFPPLYHYLKHGWKEGRSPNPLFDLPWYLKNNPDIVRRGYEPLSHYIKHGWKEGRPPNALFDLSWYLKCYPELLANGEEPLSHYIAHNGGESLLLGQGAFLNQIISTKYGPKAALSVAEIIKYYQLFNKKVSSKNQETFDFSIKSLRAKIENNHKKESQVCDISIIIPVHNQLVYTLGCIVSILEEESKCSYEILIGDDASTDKTQEVLNKIHPLVKVVHHSKNVGFVKNCNETAKQAKGKYIVFLNNDTIVLPRWADALVSVFNKHNDVGLVGAKLLNLDGTLQEAGGIIWNNATGLNYGRGDTASNAEYNYFREVDYCSGACIMIQKDLWNQLGGFDELYSPAYYEDVDLAFRVRKEGKKVCYQYLSEVIHCEGISNGKDVSQGLKSYQVANQKKFFDRWKKELQKNYYDPRKKLTMACSRSIKKKRILFIDHGIPTPDQDAGSKSVASYISFFLKRDFHVLLIGDNGKEIQPYLNMFQSMGVEVVRGNDICENHESWIAKNGQSLDYVFLSRPHTSLRWIEPLRKYTEAKLLFYGVDLMSRTQERAYRDTGKLEHQNISQEFALHEAKIHPLVDAIFYPSQAEVDYLSSKITTQNVKKIPLYIYENSLQQIHYNSLERKGLLFVGGFRHTPNFDAITWFIKNSFPQILKAIPDIQLTIVGSHVPAELLKHSSKNIKIYSNISDEHLSNLIQETKLSIAPLRFGGGIKGKIVDSLRSGVPVITTEIGAEGLDGDKNHMVVASLASFADKLIETYSNNTLLNEISIAGLKYIEDHFSEQSMKEALGEYIPEIK